MAFSPCVDRYVIRLCDEIIAAALFLLAAGLRLPRRLRPGLAGLAPGPCLGFAGCIRRRHWRGFGSGRLGGSGSGAGGPGRLCAVGQDLGHAQQGEFLPVAALAARILAASLLEGDDLRPAPLLQDLGGDRGAGNRRRAERDVVAAHHQDFAELDDLAGVGLDLVDLDDVLGGNAVLLAAGSDDCEHRSSLRVRSRCPDRPGPAFCSRMWALTAGARWPRAAPRLMAAAAETVKEPADFAGIDGIGPWPTAPV